MVGMETTERGAMGRHGRRAAAAAALCLLAWGCGKKGDPTPPLRIIPAMTSDLAATQRGDQLVLRFGYPATTTSGAKLPGLAAVEVWQVTRPAPPPRPSATPPAAPPPTSPDSPAAASPDPAMATPPDPTVATPPDPAAPPPDPATAPTPVPPPPLVVGPPEFAAAAQLVATLTGAELQSATAGDSVVVRLPLPPPTVPPTAHVFGVKTRAEGGETSGWSNLAQVVPQAPPAPPAELAVTAQARGVELSWTSPATPVAGFAVYRRPAMSRAYGEPLAVVGPEATQHLDTTAAYGQRYIYSATALASRRPRVESAFGAEREIDYEDRFAPAAPDDVVALPGEGGVTLLWKPSPDADVAGYHVYRRDPDADFRRLTTAPVTELRFSDSGLAGGLTFTYRVTAVDAVGNEGPPSADLGARPR